uniref:Peptidase S1 domain-containing protein n=1 Tax=Anopheles epiroticus TaxID=199890 RepID=A0A182PRS7_9DIPT
MGRKRNSQSSCPNTGPRYTATLDLYFSHPTDFTHQFSVVFSRIMVLYRMGPAMVLLLALCVAGVWSDEAQDAYAARQRRVVTVPNNGGHQKKFSGRIVGGTEELEPLPYLLSLRDSGFHICGASIISGKHALTAAHCQSPPSNTSRLTLLGGVTKRTDDENGIVLQVERVVTHPDFVAKTYLNDVAIITITTSFLDHPRLSIMPIISTNYKLLVNSIALTSGWGLTAKDSTLAARLLSVRIPVVSYRYCVSKWHPVHIVWTSICAGQEGRDSCNGDSGGPLVQNGVQIGIVSWGADRCGSEYPGIYTYIGNRNIRKFIFENSGLPYRRQEDCITFGSQYELTMKAFILLSLFVAGALAGYEESVWLSKQVRIDAGTSAEYSGRIVGGSAVPISQFPYQLSLRQNGNHICGASVISSNWALSAAHCTFPMPSANAITFRGGSSSRTTGGVIFQAAQIINHPQYNNNNLNNDVCVIRITTSFVGTNIAPIRLVSSGTSFAAGTNSVVSGWGLTSPGGSLPVDLRAVNIPVVAQATCSSQWGTGRITAAMVCAGAPGRDSCNGDSGGPLVTGGQQFGIVSWGAVQCGGSLPGVYANIGNAGIRSFISQNTGVVLIFASGRSDVGSEIWREYNTRLPKGSFRPPETSRKSARIVGGRDAAIENFPYQLSLRRSGVHACGASVIALRWALSAAHCTYPVPQINEMSLRAGSGNRLSGGTITPVTQIINHPRFSEYTIEYDVCLLQTQTELVGQFIWPVTLPPATSGFAPGTMANITGWGLQSVPGSLPVQLQYVSVLLVSTEECRNSWPAEWIMEDMLCAGQTGRDTCGGDSGGPLVINGYQMGIASWGVSDCSGSMPSVFANTAHPAIRSFIQEHSGV